MPQPKKGKEKGAISRGILILESFLSSPDGRFSAAQVTDATGLPQPTVSRYLQALAADSYLVKSKSDNRYCLGPAVLSLGFSPHWLIGNPDKAGAVLQRIADTYRVHVGVHERAYLHEVCIKSIHSGTAAFTLQIERGAQEHVAHSVAGAALLASLDNEQFNYFCKLIEEEDPTIWRERKEHILSARAIMISQGVLELEKYGYPDVSSIAASVVGIGNSLSCSVVCSFPSGSLSQQAIKSLKIGLKKAATDLSDTSSALFT